ncbi:MAG TPA: TonB-dependent receptor, partial [Flavobacteriaceae bacterium]|nr:TonB-dependent receptor [Flavobacteriaceae bacterium]
NLEELLKKLPGVEVDNEGNITVNGKPVNKILVNGEEFFGGDPKIATKNLPKEIIDKIQVVSTKTKSEEFTGKAGDPDNKTINIELKEDMDKGYFSRLTAAGGTDERYNLSGIANYFNGDFRLSVLGGTNNINESGFSSSELWELMGSNAFNFTRSGNTIFFTNGGIFGRGDGLTKSTSGGINLTNKWNETTELGGTYFYGRKDTEKRTKIYRENILPDSRYFTNSVSSSNFVSDAHKADLELEFEPDTLTRISIKPHLQINTGYSVSNSSSESLDESESLINSSETFTNLDNYSGNFSNRLNFIRKFGGDGAYLEFHFNNTHDKYDGEQFFFSERIIYDETNPETETQNQFIDEERKENRYEAGISNRSVLAKDFFLDISYDLEIENGSSTRDVFDFNIDAQAYSDFDESLSNEFEFNGTKHIPNVGLSYEGEKWRASFDAGLLNTTLKSENLIDDVAFENTYNNLYLSSYVRYQLKKSSSVYFNYRTNSNVPSLQQLQPVTDRTNPLNIITGNPNLKPEFSQNIRFGMRNYDFATRSGYYIYGSVNFTDDQVVSISTTDENLLRTTTYTNVDGNYRMSLGGSFNKRYKKEKRIFKYGAGLWGSMNNSVGFSNGKRYESQGINVTPRISLGYEIGDIFSISARYSLGYRFSQYDIFQNREESFANHNINLDLTTFWPENIIFESEIDYGYDGNVRGSFDPTSVLWNASLGYKFLDDNATIELQAYDLLNQNVSTYRSTGEDYIQDTQNLVLERYFMLSFTYKLTKFGGKDPNE